MAIATNLGFPRIGANRELKKAVESFWKGDTSEAQLQAEAKKIRETNWKMQKDAGLSHIPCNDFSFYDQMLDMSCLVGAVPERYGFSGDKVDLKTYFLMARGGEVSGKPAIAMEMTKWFDTNYHYLVPEFTSGQKFALKSSKIFDEFKEAKALGVQARPVIIGPVSYLMLGKMKDAVGSPVKLLDNLLPAYAEIMKNLESAGAEWVQIDEPCLVLDLSDEQKKAFDKAYAALSKASNLKIMLATYFGDLRENLDIAAKLPVTALHVDLKRAEAQLEAALDKIPASMMLSLGLVDGRNIWKCDLDKAVQLAEKAAAKIGSERIMIAPSCSLIHSPVDLDNEKKLDGEIKNWMAFAKQKLTEVAVIAKAVNEGRSAVKAELESNAVAIKNRSESRRIHQDAVKKRLAAVNENMMMRQSPFAERIEEQKKNLGLPLFPTTTIGSFPQTAEVRQARSEFKSGKRDAASYDAFLKQETANTVKTQEEMGIDVLVHGEFERNDMVEYFGEQLDGFTFTANGWVQSYGSRCVKPPVIFGDVSRPKPMTVEWSKYAQSLTPRAMKGMLTGPVTILQWSFVRDDQPRETTCKQIALAIRDEVVDLEQAGIKVIQIDEPAIREGLPLRRTDWATYLKWAVDSFRLSAAGVKDGTQIHTHMCYSEFNDIIEAIARMDADAISIETSRSQMELLDAFANFKYPNQIGPGVYDIHSPRVPTQEEMEDLLRKAMKVIPAEQLWVNPDCGLKTRGWKEVKPALEKMVAAARTLRSETESLGMKTAKG